MTYIAPHFQDTDHIDLNNLDTKIKIFEDRIIWWKLLIADNLINGGTDILGNFHELGIHGSGFAVLDIVFSYFELIAKYYEGYTGNNRSREYFKKGIELVFPNIMNNSKIIVDDLLNILYEDCRCNLYHSGFLSSRILLTHEFPENMGYDPINKGLIINPHKLPKALMAHLESYINQLHDESNIVLRDNFEKRFDCK